MLNPRRHIKPRRSAAVRRLHVAPSDLESVSTSDVSALGAAFEHAPVAQLAVSFDDHRLAALNHRARRLFAVGRHHLPSLENLWSDHREVLDLLRDVELYGEMPGLESELRSCDGRSFWARLDASRLGTLVLVAIHDVSAYRAEHSALRDEREQLRERLGVLRGLAARDALTHLPNRRAYEEQVALEVERAQSTREPLCLAMIDIDFFKRVNDTHGHQAGDSVLSAVAQLIRESIRRNDLVARYGGEEFVVVMPSTTLAQAFCMLERLRTGAESRPLSVRPDAGVSITLSIGVTELRPEDDPESLLMRADGALYRAKRGGRNQSVRG
ncbi:MAG: GGDEF domain-containing protein [Myxococcota bacterium]